MARSLRGEGEPLTDPIMNLPVDKEHVAFLRQLNSYYQSKLPQESIGLTRDFIDHQPAIYRARISGKLLENGNVDIAELSRLLREDLGAFFNLEAFDSAVDFIDEYTKSKEKLISELESIYS